MVGKDFTLRKRGDMRFSMKDNGNIRRSYTRMGEPAGCLLNEQLCLRRTTHCMGTPPSAREYSEVSMQIHFSWQRRPVV
jgi:hypothetical protein